MGLGEKLRAKAKSFGLTDAEIARKLGISPRRYSHYKIGRNEPSIEMLIKICQILNSTPNEMLEFSNSQFEPEFQTVNKDLFYKLAQNIESKIILMNSKIDLKTKIWLYIALYETMLNSPLTKKDLDKFIEEKLQDLGNH